MCAVFEIAGRDQKGLLASVMELLTTNACEAQSAAVGRPFLSMIIYAKHPLEFDLTLLSRFLLLAANAPEAQYAVTRCLSM
jgi:predicted amino acid-binding ACT domain protein